MNHSTPAPTAAKACAVAGYLTALAAAAALGAFVLLLGLGWAPERARLPAPWPWLINAGWLLGFGLQHSIMARASFKRRWTRIVPPYLERSCYATLSGLLLLGMAATWQPVGGEQYGLVTRHRGLRGERVHRLGAGDSRDRLEREAGDPAPRQALDAVRICQRLQERDQDRAFRQALDFFG